MRDDRTTDEGEPAGRPGALEALEPRPPAERTFALSVESESTWNRWLADGLAGVMAREGYRRQEAPGPDVRVVLHLVDADAPRPYRRRAAPTFVVAIAELPEPPSDVLRAGYPLLVRALANLCVMVAPGPEGPEVHFVTLEQGRYHVPSGLAEAELFERTFRRIEPLACSRLVIANEFRADLPEALWGGDDRTRQMLSAGRRLDALDLLPAPFPLEEILPERDRRHVQLLYGIGGLSYGNVSTRRLDADGSPTDDFWMSASGVDKSELRTIGEHILLVKDYDPELDAMVISVPPGIRPRRVSVDAIEHWMIYREHPEVGAIVHVHGWIDGTVSTEINYPCGTLELAASVADLVRRAPDPARAVVGQRNHGLTITGRDLDEIFDRVGDRIVPRVPME